MGRRSTQTIVGIIVCIIWQAPALVAQQAGQAPVAAGEKLFVASCQTCHGEAGVGNRAPTLRGARLTVDYVTRVVGKGKPGTMMPAFENAFSPEQIRQLALYVRSLHRPDSPWAALRGNASSGERVFFDATQAHSCQVCHSIQGRGAKVGPDLGVALKGKSPREIFEKIVIVPHRSADPAYANVAIVTRTGERLIGVRGEETGAGVRFYETSVLPPKVLTLAKADIASSKPLTGSAMPSDYASRLPLQQLLDLVAFLKSRADGKPASVGFDDVIATRSSNR
jgi:putative heme-binding domain-containing protein